MQSFTHFCWCLEAFVFLPDVYLCGTVFHLLLLRLRRCQKLSVITYCQIMPTIAMISLCYWQLTDWRLKEDIGSSWNVLQFLKDTMEPKPIVEMEADIDISSNNNLRSLRIIKFLRVVRFLVEGLYHRKKLCVIDQSWSQSAKLFFFGDSRSIFSLLDRISLVIIK